eukprot:tig00000254_g22448.t1
MASQLNGPADDAQGGPPRLADPALAGYAPAPRRESTLPRRSDATRPKQAFVPPATIDDKLGIPPYRALFVLKPRSWIRIQCARLLRSPLYSILNLAAVTIVCANIASMGEGPVWNGLEIAVTVYFTIECIVKILKLGFVLHKGSYLRSPWNVLELVVTILGWLSLVASLNNFTSLRTLRVLRTLKSISALKTVRLFTDAVLAAIPMLLQCGIQIIFFFVLFGIVGTSVFSAALRFRAVDALTGTVPMGQDVEAPLFLCGDPLPPARNPGPGLICVPWDNPSYGYTSFDNILWVWLLLWQCLTMSQWTWFMYWTWDSMGAGTILYFWAVILFGSFAIVNLTLAVVNDTYVGLLEKEKDVEPEPRDIILSRRGSQVTTRVGRAIHATHFWLWARWNAMSKWVRVRAHKPLKDLKGPRARVETMLGSSPYRFVVDASTWFGVILLVCYYPDMPEGSRHAVEWLNVACVVFYAFDALLRVRAKRRGGAGPNGAGPNHPLITPLVSPSRGGAPLSPPHHPPHPLRRRGGGGAAGRRGGAGLDCPPGRSGAGPNGAGPAGAGRPSQPLPSHSPPKHRACLHLD